LNEHVRGIVSGFCLTAFAKVIICAVAARLRVKLKWARKRCCTRICSGLRSKGIDGIRHIEPPLIYINSTSFKRRGYLTMNCCWLRLLDKHLSRFWCWVTKDQTTQPQQHFLLPRRASGLIKNEQFE